MQHQTIERFAAVFNVGGIGLLIIGLIISVVLPLIAIYNDTDDTASIEDIAANPDGSGFATLANLYPDQFERYWPEGASPANYADALELGRDLYIEHACFECHTQQVRPFAFETTRYGNASTLYEQNNDLQKPQLLGTRRIGPDLARAGRDIEYLVQYFWDPQSQVANARMPTYRSLYEEQGMLNEDGFALITYISWLGEFQPAAPSDDTEEEANP